MAVTAKQSSDFMTFFSKNCPKAPKFNRATAKWAARDLLESYGVDDCQRAVLWYAKVNIRPDWNTFVRVAGDCIKEADLAVKDVENRKKYRSIANEWRKS